MFCIIGWRNRDIVCLRVPGLRSLLENGMWLQVGSVTVNRWWTCAAAGQILTFLIIASLSSKDFFFYKSGTFLLFLLQEKPARRRSQRKFCYQISTSRPLWQSVKINIANMTALCRLKQEHEWRGHKERKRLIREGRSWANGEAVRKRAKEYLARDLKK